MALTDLAEYAPPETDRLLKDEAGELYTRLRQLLAAIDKHYDGRVVRVNSQTSPRRCVKMAVKSMQTLMNFIHGRPSWPKQGIKGEPSHPEIARIRIPQGIRLEEPLSPDGPIPQSAPDVTGLISAAELRGA